MPSQKSQTLNKVRIWNGVNHRCGTHPSRVHAPAPMHMHPCIHTHTNLLTCTCACTPAHTCMCMHALPGFVCEEGGSDASNISYTSSQVGNLENFNYLTFIVLEMSLNTITIFQMFQKYSMVKVVYIIGTPKDGSQQQKLLKEQKTHCDMIQFNFQDSYHNQTIKTGFSIQYFYRNLWDKKIGPPHFLVKGDDDIFVNIPGLVSLVGSYHEQRWAFHLK